ncbi:MAG: DUF2189 domain-containing protein [Gammaproteobacteria bacterium]
MSQQDPASPEIPEEASLPFVAPCRIVPVSAPLRWLAAGWKDLRAAWRQSLSWGLVVFVLSLTISLIAYSLGSLVLLLTLLSGFVLMGPLLAIALYIISWRLERGRAPTFRRSIAEARRQLGNCAVYALVLMVVFLIWARSGSMVHVFFPIEAAPDLAQLTTFLGVGSAVGAVFAAITFAASAFSLPMITDRQTDTVTAVVTSVNAVLRNKPAMLVWMSILVLSVLIGFATAFVGLIVLFPLLGHATWHSYKDVIDASDWPRNEPMGMP